MKQKNMLTWLALIACFQMHSISLNADEGEREIVAHSTTSHDKWSDDSSDHMSSAHKKLDVKGHNDETAAYDFTVWGMFTYWVMTTPQGVIGELTTSTTPTSALIQKNVARPGFKVGVELTLPPAMVDVDVAFTWFDNSKGRNSYTNTVLPAGFLFESNATTGGGIFANTFYRIDFTVDKELMFGDHLTLVPGGGLIGIWGRGWWNETFINNAVPPNTFVDQNSQNIWGVGPYADFSAEFNTQVGSIAENAQWVFFMKNGTGFAWTNKKSNFDTFADTVQTVSAKSDVTRLQQMVDGSLGLRWEMMPGTDNAFGTWALNIAWDYQWWPKLFISDVTDQDQSVTMTIQGFTTGLSVTF